jgi:hypothetical protein
MEVRTKCWSENFMDNIQIDFKEIVCEGFCWIHMAEGSGKWKSVVNMVMNVRYL